ncbi:MAG: GGDEF domain-containing protein [Desulfobacteraceae bacterium]|nr:GGDEF domain-containing protein [Desulfobacteraceae bacterium]
MADMDSKHYELQNRIDKLETQKSTLLRELDDLEERHEKADKLYKKYLPLIVDSVADSDSLFSDVCKDLSLALKKGASIGKLEYIFNQLRDVLLKEEVEAVHGKKGWLPSFVKKSSSSLIQDFKNGYHDVVNNLKSTLGKEYNKRLDIITDKLNQCTTSNDINEIRNDLFELLQAYISESAQDREKIAAFVQEIVKGIFDIEASLAASYKHTGDIIKANDVFELTLSSELGELKESTNVAQNLEDLKREIAERLTAIDNALKDKRAKDQAVKKDAKLTLEAFKQGFVKLKQELDEATEQSKELEKKVYQDQLTGAYNRRAYDRRAAEEMDRFLRYGNVFSLLLIDADYFKKINDKYGHAIGDKCLKEMIKRTITLLRKVDMLARYGGEEFTIIMPETDKESAKQAAEKIRKNIEKIEFVYKEEKVKVTVSIGVSQISKDDKKFESLFERADIAVYKAKSNGRNQVVVN